ncbi:RNA 2'-phosphotransferase [Paenibacillus dendritiformis]|uniref:RNA 2'-phosphotransferase n=1 Tax=Paenibacillus dendritiformis TaxID=130049 RepID=UPI00387E1977
MKKDKFENLSKFFTKILRHEPSSFGLTLNEKHFCKLEDFYDVVIQNWKKSISKEEILYVLINSKWQEYHRFDVCRGYVRATYRHTYKENAMG